MYTEIRNQICIAMTELLDIAGMKPGEIFAIGCSSSEILGEHIGKGSSPEIGRIVAEAAVELSKKRGLYLAAQCCEHLNRALIIERAAAEKYGLEPVCVRPVPKAGGSFASSVWEAFDAPVAVEHVRAAAGLDIGGTLIGMHLREVAVPVRLSVRKIGDAVVIGARTRPKLIGGIRAQYPED